jgi:hypothetical protein
MNTYCVEFRCVVGNAIITTHLEVVADSFDGVWDHIRSDRKLLSPSLVALHIVLISTEAGVST